MNNNEPEILYLIINKHLDKPHFTLPDKLFALEKKWLAADNESVSSFDDKFMAIRTLIHELHLEEIPEQYIESTEQY